MMSSKNLFKYLIKEFHETWSVSNCIEREVKIPTDISKVVVVYGARRSGKTFLFYNSINSLINRGVSKEFIVYINFEDDRLINLRINDLNNLLEAYYELYPENLNSILYFYLDEIQNIQGWEAFVRRVNDSKKIRIFLTGSSAKLLSKEIATSLRGRCLTYALYPFSFKEFLLSKEIVPETNIKFSNKRFKVKKFLEEYLEYGSFPDIVLNKEPEIKKKILKEYYDSLVYKDLADRFVLKNTDMLKDLLRYLLTNFTKEFSIHNYYKITKNSMSVSRDTITDYLSCIQETSYFFLLNHFSFSLKSQKVKPKKIIILDNGIRNIVSFRTSSDLGKLAENIVGVSLIKNYSDVFYWKEKGEVDFITMDKDGSLNPINVTFGDEISKREFTSLKEFKSSFKKVKNLTLITKDTEGKKDNITLIPLWKWLLYNT